MGSGSGRSASTVSETYQRSASRLTVAERIRPRNFSPLRALLGVQLTVLFDSIGVALPALALLISADPLVEGPVPGEAGAAGVLGQQQTLASIGVKLIAKRVLRDHREHSHRGLHVLAAEAIRLSMLYHDCVCKGVRQRREEPGSAAPETRAIWKTV
jgi:hypothetical protein